LSSPWRKLPDFVIIGAQKSGTSSMYYYLSQHPDVSLSFEKEIHYYNYYIDHGKSLGWYKSFFPLKSSPKITGEASPNYLYAKLAAQKLKLDVPEVKLIVLLRNPIDRAYSEYNMHVRQSGKAHFPTFEEAIANEDYTMEVSRVYLSRGIYTYFIKQWLEYFDRDRFLFVKSEDLFQKPRETLATVYEFLCLDQVYPDNLNPQEAGEYSRLAENTRTTLEEYFRAPNEELANLAGECFRW